MRHINIPIFVPHLGCPHDCVFCNQKTITGKSEPFDPAGAEEEIRRALSTIDRDETEVEIAFFGGSFTGIERKLMLSLLEISDKFIESGEVSAVRCSTRPDYIDEEILDILKEHHVKTVEIGVQSMSDKVLDLCERGHTSDTTRNACRLIVSKGFDLVGQMMVALPGSSPEDEINTAKEICALGALGARIYPTVVFGQTKLCSMSKSGAYTPLGAEEAALRCADLLDIFISNGVKVIRIGLCESEGLHGSDGIYAGAFHPALGELCISEYCFKKEKELIASLPEGAKAATILLPKGFTSKAVGQKKKNKERLASLFPDIRISFSEDETLEKYVLRVIPGQ